MISHTYPSTLNSIFLIGKTVGIELLRKKDFYVLLIIMALFLVGIYSIKVAGIDNSATAVFLLNLGMTLVWFMAHLLTLLLAARQIPDEMDNRTLYPLLAKPVDRFSFIIGKWLACTFSGIGCFGILYFFTWIAVPSVESSQAACLMQSLFLHAVSLGLIASLAITFSLFLPRGINLVILGLLFTLGNKVTGFLMLRFDQTPLKSAVNWLIAYVPDFSKLNLITRYTDGISALTFNEFTGCIFYGLLFTTFSLYLAFLNFNKRPL